MNFEFNENQNDLRAMVRELAEKEIGPRAKENDEKDVFPVEIYKMMADMGLTAIGVPEEFGGRGCRYNTCSTWYVQSGSR